MTQLKTKSQSLHSFYSSAYKPDSSDKNWPAEPKTLTGSDREYHHLTKDMVNELLLLLVFVLWFLLHFLMVFTSLTLIVLFVFIYLYLF